MKFLSLFVLDDVSAGRCFSSLVATNDRSISNGESVGVVLTPTLARWLLTLVLALVPAIIVRADAPPTSVHIVNSGLDSEGFPTFRLEWNAVSNATYLVQSRTNLSSGDSWQTVDAITPTTALGVYPLKGQSVPTISVKFFQLVLPQPEISSVEPAVLPPGVTTDLYIVGQCFSSNDVLRINGVTQSTVLLSPTLRSRPAFTADVPGDYLFELVVAGQVRSSFTVVCADAFANPELVLQGPPQEPLASPQSAFLSKKGYDYYKAQGDLASAGLNHYPYFKENSQQGEMPAGKFAGKKGYDHYHAQGYFRSAGYSDHVGARPAPREALLGLFSGKGKKGLNAVNVKLACIAGGGDDCDDGDPGAALLMPALMKAKEKANRTKCGNNLRVAAGDCDDSDPDLVPFSGEIQCQTVDLMVEGRGLDFAWGRTYHSRIGRNGLSVNGWTFCYDIHVQSVGTNILVNDGTGRQDVFRLKGSVYTCPEFFSEGTLSNNIFRLTFADTGYWEFNPFDGSPSAGTLARIVDRNGNNISLNYTSGLLDQVVDDLGRTNTIAHDANGRVSSVTDFSGRTVTYRYYGGKPGEPGNLGDLASVTSPIVTNMPNGNDFPLGKTTTYTYSTGYANDAENHLLLSVIDATGQTTHQFTYQHNQTDLEFIRCKSVQRWTNSPTIISYLPQTPTPGNQFASLRCVLNDPVGNVSEYFYDARNRCVKFQEYTGRATPNATRI